MPSIQMMKSFKNAMRQHIKLTRYIDAETHCDNKIPSPKHSNKSNKYITLSKN